jgi:hypothetical protein
LFKNKYLEYFHRGHANAVRLAVLLLFAACLAGPGMAGANFTFVAFGDTPYTDDEETRFIGMIAEINREKPAFSIHVGDFKSGSSPCTDALFLLRREQFALFHQPLIYTPGDNEWSDCWRAPGAARDPLERLQKLRSLFFADGHSLGQQKIVLARQNALYPEHAQWAHEGILFATLNVPGGNNNMRMPEEWAAREQGVRHWVQATFARARAERHHAVVLAMQANPFLRSVAVKNGYESLLHALASEAQKFDGEVLLIHGDTHRFRIDQPLTLGRGRQRVANVTRLEVYGYPLINWVRVRVSQRNGKVVFEISPGA